MPEQHRRKPSGLARHMTPDDVMRSVAPKLRPESTGKAAPEPAPVRRPTRQLEPKPETPELPAEEEGTLDESVHKSAALISVCVLISRITGFFRTWAMAFAMGSTLLASSYQVANNLPMMLYDMVIGGMLVTAFLPVYVSTKKRLGEEGGNEYASNLLTLTVLFVGTVSILCSVFAPQLIFTQSFLSDQSTMETSIFFFRFFAFQILFYAAGSIVSGLLNAHRDFLWSSIAPVFNNIIVIATFVAYAIVAPNDPQLGLWIIAIGNPLGVLTQLAIQLPALKRNGIRIRFHIDIHDPAIKETLSIGIPAFVVMVTSFMVVSVQNAAAYNIADNGPSIIAYARLWFTLPYAFLAVPITTAMFTELSEFIANENMDGFKDAIIKGTRQILFLTIPFGMFLMVFAFALVNLYHAGAFTTEHVEGVAIYLIFVALSLPFYSVNTYLQKTFSALRQLKRYAVYNIICTVLQIVFTLVLATQPWPDWHMGMAIIALGDTLFFATSDLLCALYLHRTYGDFGVKSVALSALRGISFGVPGAAAGAGIIIFLDNFVAPFMGSILVSFLYIVIAGSAALLITFGLAIKLRRPEVQPIVNILDRVKAKLGR
ncbi:MAG: murein biosynthesis integral membrane protein MurJ [Coriobacteriia bacterium]|nr:murein biosynthesis integral membrane protein MurJ [Coriobacteriia bacterium]